jgi:hypothetical protein
MTSAQRDVLRFPAERVSHPARNGATVADIAKGRFRRWVGHLLNRAGVPGALAPIEIHDHATGQHVAVAVGARIVRLTVNGRDFYFDRLTGRYDGTGSATI